MTWQDRRALRRTWAVNSSLSVCLACPRVTLEKFSAVRKISAALRERDGQRQPFGHGHDHDRYGDGEEVDQRADVVRREVVEVDRSEESGR